MDCETRKKVDSTKRKAYLNCLPDCVKQTGVLLDEQFKFVQNGSGAEQVGDDQEFKVHTPTSNISKNGYLYVFVSNETPNINVFFDNLQVTHLKGPLLEESHYYPFGTEMSAISSHSLPSYVPNRYKANGGAEYGDEEWNNGSGLEMYETFYRSYNAQIGRFMQGDPKMEATVSMSGYVFSGNNPVMFTDLLGDLQKEVLLQEIVIEADLSGGSMNKGRFWDLFTGSGGGDGFGNGNDWSFLGESNDGGGRRGNRNSSQGIDSIPKASKPKITATKAAVTLAISASAADGPLPFGEAFGVLIIGGAVVYDHWDDVVSTAEELTSFFGTFFSKGGKQNKWPDNYGPPPTATNTDWSMSDSELADRAANRAGDYRRGPGTPHNEAKKVFRDKRPRR